jgi:hypothetical protein
MRLTKSGRVWRLRKWSWKLRCPRLRELSSKNKTKFFVPLWSSLK